MDVGVNLRMLDGLSGPAARATEAMRKLHGAVRGLGAEATNVRRLAHAYDHLANRAAAASAKMASLRSKALGAAGAAFGLGMGLKQGADWEMQLRRFLQIAGQSGGELNKNLLGISTEMIKIGAETRSPSSGLMQAMSTMTNLGMAAEDAKTAIRGIGRAAVASGADADDLARAFQGAWQHLGLSANASEPFFNVAHTAGKMGGFELKDMARFFPSILANYGMMYGDYIARSTAGMTDAQAQVWKDDFALRKIAQVAGWAQIVRLGAGDSMTAGTNLQNMLQKNLVPETAKNFQKHLGVNFREGLWAHVNKGGDPIEYTASMIAALVEKNKGNRFFLGDLFADKQAMEGYLPVVAHYMQKRGQLETFHRQIREAVGSGAISKDWLSTVQSLSFRFSFLTQSAKDFWKQITMLGAGGPAGLAMEYLANRVTDLNLLMGDNPEAAGGIIRTIGVIGASLGGLAIVRFLMSGAGLLLARAGMAGITALRIIPGLVPVLSLLGPMLGPLGKLGLLGGAGFAAFTYWDQIKPMLNDMFGGMGGRLQQMFPGAFDWINNVALPKLYEWLGLSKEKALELAATIRQIGSDFYSSLNWLFTGKESNDPGETDGLSAWERMKSSIAGMMSSIGGSDTMKSAGNWWAEYSKRLAFGDGFSSGIGAWAKLLGGGFGVFTAWAVGTHGLAGLLLALAGVRSLVFVIGTVVAMMQVLATLAGVFLVPLFETLMETKWFAALMRVLGPIAGGVLLIAGALYLFRAHWDAIKSAWSGFTTAMSQTVGKSMDSVASSWKGLMKTLFGDGDVSYDLRQLEEIWYKFFRAFQHIGKGLRVPFDLLAGSIDLLAGALERLKAVIGQENFDFLVKWASVLLGSVAGFLLLASAFRAMGAGVSMLAGALWRLSGIPWARRLLGMGGAAGAAAFPGFVHSGMAAGAGATAALSARALLGRGPIGALALAFMLANEAHKKTGGLTGYEGGVSSVGPAGGYLDIHQRRALRPGFSPNEAGPKQIKSLAGDLAGGIKGGGDAIVGALNAVASSIYNAIGRLGSTGTGAVDSRAQGALSDGATP